MSNVLHIRKNPNSVVTRASVQVSEYSEENGGSEVGTGTLYAVETLFPDGTWALDGWFRDAAKALEAAEKVAADRGAARLSESLWPNRQVKGGAQ